MPTARILVVEDEDLVRQFVEAVLVRKGYDIQTAETAEAGLEQFGQHSFHVVISDVNLPDMDGIEMVKQMRASDPTIVPVVMTARRDQETAVRAMECGAQDFLMKPFNLHQLMNRLNHALQEQQRIVDTRVLIGDLIQTRSTLQQQVQEREDRLTKTELYLHHMIDAAPFGVVSTDREGRILTFNDKAERMYGYQRGEVIGHPIGFLFSKSPPSDSEKAYHRRKDGEGIPVLVHVQDIVDDQGLEIAHLYMLEDRSEREQLERQLLSADRLSLLGQMAPRIGHEFKTPLQLISGHAELALMSLNQNEIDHARSSLEQIQPSIQQVLHMIREMINLGKPEESREEAVDLKEELKRLLNMLRPLGAIKYCEVKEIFEDNLPLVYGDPTQLEQVFRNLIVNAAHAMESCSERILTLQLERTENGGVRAVVRDTGEGIPESHLEQIFEPFYTTKEDGHGTGLGLPIVKSVLERHGATIEVESRVNQGTAFVLIFPEHKPVGDDLVQASVTEASENGAPNFVP
ncbi:MAG: response regulator [bacterium]|nr:response regulator [bacterium]